MCCSATHDVHTALLNASALRERFPWLETEGLVLGSLGLSTATSGEGWFDGYAAMQAFRRAAISRGGGLRRGGGMRILA